MPESHTTKKGDNAGMISKLNGNLTGPSAAIIAVVLILGQFGVIGGDHNSEMVEFQTQVTMEHDLQMEHSKDIAAEVKTLAEVNREMVIILRDIKADMRAAKNRSAP